MQILINGLISGSAIALLALAFQIVYLPTRVFFIAMGGLYSVAPYLAQAVFNSGTVGILPAVFMAVIGVVGLSVLCEWVNHGPLARRNASDGAQLVTSLGIYILIVQVIAMIWGNETKTLQTGLDMATKIGEDIVVTGAQWVILITSIAFIGGFALFLNDLAFDLRLGALSDNSNQSALFGYNVGYHQRLVFGHCGLFVSTNSLVSAYIIDYDP